MIDRMNLLFLLFLFDVTCTWMHDIVGLVDAEFALKQFKTSRRFLLVNGELVNQKGRKDKKKQD